MRSRIEKIQPMREEDSVAFESVDEACASRFGSPSFRWDSSGIDGRWLCFHAFPLSACSAGLLADRPCQKLGRSGGNRLKQGQDDCHEAQ